MRLLKLLVVCFLAFTLQPWPELIGAIARAAPQYTGPGCGSECTPWPSGSGNRLDNVNGGSIKVCINDAGAYTFDSNFINGIQAGFAYWTSYTAQNSALPQVSVSYAYNDYSGCQVTIYPTNLASSVGANTIGNGGNGDPMTIQVNGNKIDSSHSENFWRFVGAHEFGHMLGVGHAEDCDYTQTVMVSVDDSWDESLPSSPACADSAVLSLIYLNQESGYNGGSYSDQTQEELSPDLWCDFHYIVTDYYRWTPSGWTYWFSFWDLQYWDNCEPLECC